MIFFLINKLQVIVEVTLELHKNLKIKRNHFKHAIKQIVVVFKIRKKISLLIFHTNYFG